MTERLTIRASTSRDEGGCNFCNRYPITAEGVRPDHPVYVVGRSDGTGIAPRMCRDCIGDLTTGFLALVVPT